MFTIIFRVNCLKYKSAGRPRKLINWLVAMMMISYVLGIFLFLVNGKSFSVSGFHNIFMLTSGASQTQLPVWRLAYIFSLLFGSMISTHWDWSFTADKDLPKECIIALLFSYLAVISESTVDSDARKQCGTWLYEWTEEDSSVNHASEIIWIREISQFPFPVVTLWARKHSIGSIRNLLSRQRTKVLKDWRRENTPKNVKHKSKRPIAKKKIFYVEENFQLSLLISSEFPLAVDDQSQITCLSTFFLRLRVLGEVKSYNFPIKNIKMHLSLDIS